MHKQGIYKRLKATQYHKRAQYPLYSKPAHFRHISMLTYTHPNKNHLFWLTWHDPAGRGEADFRAILATRTLNVRHFRLSPARLPRCCYKALRRHSPSGILSRRGHSNERECCLEVAARCWKVVQLVVLARREVYGSQPEEGSNALTSLTLSTLVSWKVSFRLCRHLIP